MATEPLRVLHVAAGNLYGGVEVLLATLLRRRDLFVGSRHALALCFEGRLSAELETLGARPLLLGATRVRKPWSVFFARTRLAHALHDFDLVLCHSAWSHALFAPVVRRAGLPLATFLHNETSGWHWLERWAARTAPDLVICNSEFTRQSAAQVFPGVRSAVWHPAVEVDRSQAAPHREALRAELGVDPETTLIVQVGRFERLKGHERHLRALAQLRDQPPWHCVQVGEPQSAAEKKYFDDLRRLTRELGIDRRVSFLGFRRDVAQILAAADLYCQPNLRADSFGLTLAEALGAGVPVVTSALGAAAELLGEDGILVRDDDELRVALQELIDSPTRRRQLGAGGVARWRAVCDPERQFPALETVLAGVRSGPQPAHEAG
ncbi:MAG TPA: glycosyltransferase [Polyangiaceae bacterium]|nr:glycosyltransferase [Polyangiaceae bacterium]